MKIFGDLAAIAVLCVAGGAAHAATVAVTVTVEADGKPLPSAVVTLQSAAGEAISMSRRTALTAVVDQRGKQFVPHILAVEVGTAVYFPNSDNIRHDVYSFSPAKTFELPLYAGTPAKPVLFDKPGVVVLGCNIHDWMLGFIDVVPTPYFAQTNSAGVATISDVPAGHYNVTIWAPRIVAPGHTIEEAVDVTGVRLTRHYAVVLGQEPAHMHHRPDPSGALNRLKQKFGRFRQTPGSGSPR